MRQYLLPLLAVWFEFIFNHGVFPLRIRQDCECGRPYYMDRLYGGQVVRPHEYPWMAYVRVHIYDDVYSRSGGSIINSYYILTAAHSVYNKTEYNVRVYVGLHDNSAIDDGEAMPHYVSKIIRHPDYTDDGYGYDIALLKLRSEITFNKKVSPICLPNRDEDFIGRKAITAGWGYVKELQRPGQYLRHVELEVITKRQCLRSVYRHIYKPLANQLLCAYKPDGLTCEGDSGGPLMVREDENVMVLIGVVNFGRRCRPKEKRILDLVGYYEKVSYFLDWIYSETSDALYCLNIRNYK